MDEMTYLEHYGVRGMHWGVRKSPFTKAGKRAKAVKEAKNMSDKELRDKINRIQMERQYVSLSTNSYRNGKNIAENSLKKIGKLSAKAVAVAGVYGGAKYFGEKYGLTNEQTNVLNRTFQIIKILGN